MKDTTEYSMKAPPEPNFGLQFDDMGYKEAAHIQLNFNVKKTVRARVKYWLFCKCFPFKITRWDK